MEMASVPSSKPGRSPKAIPTDSFPPASTNEISTGEEIPNEEGTLNLKGLDVKLREPNEVQAQQLYNEKLTDSDADGDNNNASSALAASRPVQDTDESKTPSAESHASSKMQFETSSSLHINSQIQESSSVCPKDRAKTSKLSQQESTATPAGTTEPVMEDPFVQETATPRKKEQLVTSVVSLAKNGKKSTEKAMLPRNYPTQETLPSAEKSDSTLKPSTSTLKDFSVSFKNDSTTVKTVESEQSSTKNPQCLTNESYIEHTEQSKSLPSPEPFPQDEKLKSLPSLEPFPKDEKPESLPSPEPFSQDEKPESLPSPEPFPQDEKPESLPSPESLPKDEKPESLPSPEPFPQVEKTESLLSPETLPKDEKPESLPSPETLPKDETLESLPSPEPLPKDEKSEPLASLEPSPKSDVLDLKHLPKKQHLNTRICDARFIIENKKEVLKTNSKSFTLVVASKSDMQKLQDFKESGTLAFFEYPDDQIRKEKDPSPVLFMSLIYGFLKEKYPEKGIQLEGEHREMVLKVYKYAKQCVKRIISDLKEKQKNLNTRQELKVVLNDSDNHQGILQDIQKIVDNPQIYMVSVNTQRNQATNPRKRPKKPKAMIKEIFSPQVKTGDNRTDGCIVLLAALLDFQTDLNLRVFIVSGDKDFISLERYLNRVTLCPNPHGKKEEKEKKMAAIWNIILGKT